MNISKERVNKLQISSHLGVFYSWRISDVFLSESGLRISGKEGMTKPAHSKFSLNRYNYQVILNISFVEDKWHFDGILLVLVQVHPHPSHKICSIGSVLFLLSPSALLYFRALCLSVAYHSAHGSASFCARDAYKCLMPLCIGAFHIIFLRNKRLLKAFLVSLIGYMVLPHYFAVCLK